MIRLNIQKIRRLCLGLLGLAHSWMIRESVGIVKRVIWMIMRVVVLGFLGIGSIDLAVFKTLFEFLKRNTHLDSQTNR
jgi:hypothetical protein